MRDKTKIELTKEVFKDLYDHPVSGKWMARIHISVLLIVINSILNTFIDINIYKDVEIFSFIPVPILFYQMYCFFGMRQAYKAREDFREL